MSSGPTPSLSTELPTGSPPSNAGALEVVVGSTEKICQLLGDTDWDTGQPTAARTLSSSGLDAADLGSPVESPDGLILLFGDSRPPRHPPHETILQSELPPDDSVGVTTRTTPPDTADGKCLELQINHDQADRFLPPTIQSPIPVKQGFFNVPTGGVSLGGVISAFFWTDHCAYPNPLDRSPLDPLARPSVNPSWNCPESDDSNSVGRGILAQSSDGGRTFHHVVPMPTGFVYSIAVDAGHAVGLSRGQNLGVFIFAVPRYRASVPYLAYAPAASFTDPSTWRFFTGLDPGGQPKWVDFAAWTQSPVPADRWNPPGRAELFSPESVEGRCVGEFSVTWNSVLGTWLMVYGCSQGIVARISAAPWGPWSAPVTILSLGEQVRCKLIMSPQGCGNRRDYWPAMSIGATVEPGALYAPYVLDRFTTAEPSPAGTKKCSVYWLVSTWNPYVVVVMRSTLQITGGN